MSLFRNILASSIVEEVQITGKYKEKNAQVFNVFGRRSTFVNTTDQHDVSEATPAVRFNTVISTEALEVISSNATDSSAGVGVQTIKICYLNASNAIAVQTLTLNGTTAVSASINANEILFMEAVTVGTNTVAVGDITLRKVTGAVPLEVIKSGGNRSMSGKFMIPAGYTGYLIQNDYCAIAQNMDFRLRAQASTFDRSLQSAFIFQQNNFLASNTNSGEIDGKFLKFPALCRVKASVIPAATGGNPRADCSFTILIIQN
jgi:hypothetical protein